ncbi:galanin receptor type 1-like [Diadema antillarum]|uniref:galanin receptor type 1-like n=1 Tax=Diadema antillarum TaxID=105358 RepID=UPI003A890F80
MATVPTPILNLTTPSVVYAEEVGGGPTTAFDMSVTTPSDLGDGGGVGTKALSNDDIFAIVLYCLFGSIGIVGNLLVCVVFSLMRSRRSQVNLFIFHQAFVDLCTSILLITFGITTIYRAEITAMTIRTRLVPASGNSSYLGNDTSLTGADGEVVLVEEKYVPRTLAVFMCQLWWPRVFLFSMFVVSTFNLTTMAVERYMAIMHPFFYATKFRRRHAIVIIVCIWLLAPIMQYFPAIFQYAAENAAGECGIQETWTSSAQAALGVCLIAYEFLMPCTIMGFSSVKIYRKLRKREMYLSKATNFLMKKKNDSPPTPERNLEMVKANRNTTMVVIVIFIVYIICWSPNHITFLGFNLGMHLNFSGVWYQTTVLLAFMNSCINPFIYAIRLRVFQRGLVHMFRSGCKPVDSSNFDSTVGANLYDVTASTI